MIKNKLSKFWVINSTVDPAFFNLTFSTFIMNKKNIVISCFPRPYCSRETNEKGRKAWGEGEEREEEEEYGKVELGTEPTFKYILRGYVYSEREDDRLSSLVPLATRIFYCTHSCLRSNTEHIMIPYYTITHQSLRVSCEALYSLMEMNVWLWKIVTSYTKLFRFFNHFFF